MTESKIISISVFNIINQNAAITTEDGILVFNAIKKALENGQKVNIDFQNIKTIITPFLNAAIGQLYGQFSKEAIESSLTYTGLSEDDKKLLKLVEERAISYFKNKANVEAIIEKNGLDGDDDN